MSKYKRRQITVDCNCETQYIMMSIDGNVIKTTNYVRWHPIVCEYNKKKKKSAIINYLRIFQLALVKMYNTVCLHIGTGFIFLVHKSFFFYCNVKTLLVFEPFKVIEIVITL